MHSQVVGSIYGNCIILDGTKYLNVTASNKQTNILQNNDSWMDHDYFDIFDVGNCIENISCYIAGFVARSINHGCHLRTAMCISILLILIMSSYCLCTVLLCTARRSIVHRLMGTHSSTTGTATASLISTAY